MKLFEDIVAEYQAVNKCSKGTAISAVAKSNPDEHRAYIDRSNTLTNSRRQNRPNRDGAYTDRANTPGLSASASGERFEDIVAGFINSGCTRSESVRQAVQTNPAAHDDYVSRLRAGEDGRL